MIAESAEPDANISDVARRNGVNRGLLTVWRRQARMAAPGSAAFARALLASPPVEAARSDADRRVEVGVPAPIEIDIADARVRAPAGADMAMLKEIIAVLRSTR